MKKTIGSVALCLWIAAQAFPQEATKVTFASAPLANCGLVLSASSFDGNNQETPITYYMAYGSEVMLPKTAWTFSERKPSQAFRTGGEPCRIDYRDGDFTVTVAGKTQEMIPAGLGYQPVQAPAGGNSSCLVAFPRGYSYEGEGRLFYRSGSVQTAAVDGAEIRLYDDDMDGRYAKGKDGLSVADPGSMGVFGTLSDLLPTPNAVYEIREAAEDGSSLTLRPYPGPTGRLKIDAIPNVECRLAFASEDGKCSFGTLVAGQGLTLPAGAYRCLYGFLYRPSAKHVVALVLPSKNLPLVVGKDETVTVTLGELARRELPWGEGVVTMTVQHLLALDLTEVEDAYSGGDFAKGQKLLDAVSQKHRAGPNYEASKVLMEELRRSLAMENSAQGTALREAEARVLTAIKAGALPGAKALFPDAQKALAAIPADFTNAWSYLAHKTRVASLARCVEGTSKPGLKLTLNARQQNAASETAETVDWTDPVGKGWGHTRAYEGSLLVPRAGEYELSLESVGVADVFLDENKIIDHPLHLPAERSVKVNLTEGAHPLKIDVRCYVYGYTHGNKPHMVRFRWVPPGGSKAIVPAWAFEHRAEQ